MLFRRLTTLFLFAVLSAPSPSSAEDKHSKRKHPSVDRTLQKRDLPKRVRVIVQYRPGTGGAVAKRLAGWGARSLREHEGLRALTVEVPRAALEHMKDDADVLALSHDDVVTADQFDTSTTTSTTAVEGQTILSGSALFNSLNLLSSYDLNALRSSLGVPSTYTGSSVGVAIVDSGIAPVADLQGRISAFYDFTKGGISTWPNDQYGHGTHVAGLIAGNGQQSKTKYVGVATGVRLVGLKVLDAQGRGYTSNVIAALEFATANKARLGIDIINLSLGHPIHESVATDPLVRAVERAVASGIVVVVSAGNLGYNSATGESGYAGITSPGNAPSALTVGSVRTRLTASRLDDEVSPFSSRGPTWRDGFVKPDVLAPGQALVAISDPSTTLYQNPALRAGTFPYIRLSGTSMAAGVASGVAALVIDANRRDEGFASVLTPNAVKAILQYTSIAVADPDTSTPAMLEQGAGSINAAGATALARAIDPSMPVGRSWLQYGVMPVSLIAGVSHPWVQHIVWGDHLVWGDTVTWNLAAWALHVVWGEDDEHIVWGDDDEHIVWGDSFFKSVSGVLDSFFAWSNHLVWGDAVSVIWKSSDEHIVWGDMSDEHIVWGDSTAGTSPDVNPEH